MKEQLKKLPSHIGFIIDGNGRWAKARLLPRSAGHKAGVDTLELIIQECFYTYNIPVVSIYAFSTENWNRPKKEVDYLCSLFENFTSEKFLKKFPNAKLNIMGDYSVFPQKLIDNVNNIIEKTKDNQSFTINLGINYSGQDELVKAVQDIVDEKENHITREVIENHLYTKGQPKLDFVVRTSGEQRLSNFMLWQIAYSELYFTKTCWPAFKKKELRQALEDYQNRDRRFGAIKEE